MTKIKGRVLKANYRYLLKPARHFFLEEYKWYKTEPTKENLELFIDSWINLQYSKLQEKR